MQHRIYTCEIWKAPKNNASVTIGNSPSSEVPQLILVYRKFSILSSCMFPAVTPPFKFSLFQSHPLLGPHEHLAFISEDCGGEM